MMANSIYNQINLPLSPLKILKKTLQGIIGTAIFCGIFTWLVFTMFLSEIPAGAIESGDWVEVIQKIRAILPKFEASSLPMLFLVFFGFILLLKAIYQYFYYKLYRYDFTDDQGAISKGVISRATGVVHYNRLQNIYIDQDFLDRMFGLYDVHYETAGEKSNFYSHVDGLRKPEADKLTTFLIEKAKNISNNITPAVQFSAAILNNPITEKYLKAKKLYPQMK